MSIWDRILGNRDVDRSVSAYQQDVAHDRKASHLAFVDIEYSLRDKKIHDIGALKYDDAMFHETSKDKLLEFLNGIDYLCGHNIVNHDAKYLFGNQKHQWLLVDTLYMSPLLFPEYPYHKLVKDDKLITEQLNNPINDCKKARSLLMDEIERWHSFSDDKKTVYTSLLYGIAEYRGFLSMVGAIPVESGQIGNLIRKAYKGKICQHAELDNFIRQYPCGLAYALALIDTTHPNSITPRWVVVNFPEVEYMYLPEKS